MRFPEIYERWQKRSLTADEAADILGVHKRTFRRQCRRFEKELALANITEMEEANIFLRTKYLQVLNKRFMVKPYANGGFGIFYGPKKLAYYDKAGYLLTAKEATVING